MFLRVIGRQCLVLTSYRDGRGKVRQRQLGSFRNRETFERSWRELGQDPAHRPQLEKLREQAESLLPSLSTSDPGGKVKRAVRTLLHILATEPESVCEADLQLLRQRLQGEPPADGQQKVEWERSRLSPRRHHLGPQNSFAQSLQDWAEQLEKRGKTTDGLRARQELAERIPGQMAQIEYAAALQKMGQFEQAIQILEATNSQHAWRNLGLASLYWQQGQAGKCLEFMLKALARDGQVAKVLDRQQRGLKPSPDTLEGQEYWSRFGDLWDEAGRQFLLCVAMQPVVRARRERRPRIDKLVSPISRGWLLEKALRAARGELKWPYAGPHPL
jgi:tetratricopeptide (TPR) repeat protein